MSWIIEEYIRSLPEIKTNPDLEDDVYNNALLIEKCIDTLRQENKLEDIEYDVICAVMSGFNYTEIGKILGIDRQTASKVFAEATDKISYILGGEFTNAAFLEKIGSLGESISSRDIDEIFKRGIIRDD